MKGDNMDDKNKTIEITPKSLIKVIIFGFFLI